MSTIDALTTTTFSGRRFTRNQLRQVQETVSTLKGLSRKELAQTLCEHLSWQSPSGSNKVNACLKMLEELEIAGVVTLPEKRESKPAVRRAATFEVEPETTVIDGSLESILPIKLERITSSAQRAEYQAYLETYHYLGFRQPFGSYIGYFIVSEPLKRKVGCILFSASAAWALSPRDQWIGWKREHREKFLHLILSNDRFLIFPWVKVTNLASHSLSLATKQIKDDWLELYKYSPVLIETFVDTNKYPGTCYAAANWQHLGQTKGRGCFDPKHEYKETVKEIYVYPLESNWQETLNNSPRASSLRKKYRNDVQSSHTRRINDSFVTLWEKVVKTISEVTSDFDVKWQIRKRCIDSMMLVLLIFRLVYSKNSQSYATTIDELWDSCHKLNLPLPQKNSIAPSSFCTARSKLDETIFKSINEKIISNYAQDIENTQYRWLGHRLFAVDGSKLNLPRNLVSVGYQLPSNAYYPMGLLSCLYQLKSQMPFDFDLVSHNNERTCALKHLEKLQKDDVVVYDRGYFSYLMLHEHHTLGIHAVFRLQESSYTTIREFFAGEENDIIAIIDPSPPTRKDIKLKNPTLNIIPLQLRLIKYRINNQVFCLGTTLLDQNRYNDIQAFSDLYHGRWGIEELYKTSKHTFVIEDFHAKSERGVKQEIFAHLALITISRIFANEADLTNNLSSIDTNSLQNPKNSNSDSPNVKHAKLKTNFKNCIHAFFRNLEGLILIQSRIKENIQRTLNFITKRYQKERHGRLYLRISKRTATKWTAHKKKGRQQKQQTTLATTLPPITT